MSIRERKSSTTAGNNTFKSGRNSGWMQADGHGKNVMTLKNRRSQLTDTV